MLACRFYELFCRLWSCCWWSPKLLYIEYSTHHWIDWFLAWPNKIFSGYDSHRKQRERWRLWHTMSKWTTVLATGTAYCLVSNVGVGPWGYLLDFKPRSTRSLLCNALHYLRYVVSTGGAQWESITREYLVVINSWFYRVSCDLWESSNK